MKRIFKRLKSNTADSVMVLALTSVVFLVLIIGFTMDVNKNINTGNAFTSMAQTSAETAVKQVDSSGSLGNNAIIAFVNEYAAQISQNESQTNETQAYRTTECSTVSINGADKKLPYFEITLKTGRGTDGKESIDTKKIEGAITINSNGIATVDKSKIPPLDKSKIPPSEEREHKYTVISAEVYDATENLFSSLGPCQLRHSSVSAISFASNTDLDSSKKDTTPVETPVPDAMSQTYPNCVYSGLNSIINLPVPTGYDAKVLTTPEEGTVQVVTVGSSKYVRWTINTELANSSVNFTYQYVDSSTNKTGTRGTITIKNGC